MEPGNIYSRLESDIAQWQKLLMDVKYAIIVFVRLILK